MSKQLIKSVASFKKSDVTWIVDAVVPFQTVLQRLAAYIARADEGCAAQVGLIVEPRKEVGLQMKAAASCLKNAHLRTLLL